MSVDILEKALEMIRSGNPFALVTIVGVSGSGPRETGAKMIVFGGGGIEGTIGGGPLEAAVIKEAGRCIGSGVSAKKVFKLSRKALGMRCGGEVEVFIDVHKKKEVLLILGGGHVAEAVAELAYKLGMPFIVVDDRKEFASRERYPHARAIVADKPQRAVGRLSDKDTYIVIVTRSHMYDKECLSRSLRTGARYIGMIGSRKKVSRTFTDLNRKGVHPEKDRRVYAPIGLDLGDKTPCGIAVSVMAEILKVVNGKSGSHMRSLLPQGRIR